jgi:hypothetical protein
MVKTSADDNHTHSSSLINTRAPQSEKKLAILIGDTSMGLQGKKYRSLLNGENRATPNPPFVSISKSGWDKVDENKNSRIIEVFPGPFRNIVKVSDTARIKANRSEWVRPRCPNTSPYLIPNLNPITSRSGTIEQTTPAKSKGGETFSRGRNGESASGIAGWL